MDTFDLKWPQTDATFYTDGWRCRIVWREKRGGLGGTIDNNDQCKNGWPAVWALTAWRKASAVH